MIIVSFGIVGFGLLSQKIPSKGFCPWPLNYCMTMEVGVQGLKGGSLFIPNIYLNEGLVTIAEAETIEERQEEQNNKALRWT
jgi:hypothetical protein